MDHEIDGIPFVGSIEIVSFKNHGVMSPSEFPPLGARLRARVLGFGNTNHQIGLGVKPSQLANDESGNRIEVGLKIGTDNRLEFFGVEEVNAHLMQGYAVERIEEGRAIMQKITEGVDSVKMRLSGFSIGVLFTTSPQIGDK